MRSILVLFLVAAAQTATADDAFDQLQLQQGRWLTPREIVLRRHLALLPRQVQAVTAARQALQQVVRPISQQQEQLRQRVAETTAQMQLLRARLSARPDRKLAQQLREQIGRQEKQLAAIEKQLLPPEELGGHPAIRRQTIALIDRQHDLMLNLLFIHDERAAVMDEYTTLDDDRLRQLKAERGGSRWGPREDYLSERMLRRLQSYEAAVFDGRIPMYRDGSRLRIAGLINRAPVTFTWGSAGESTTLTHSAAEAAGLTPAVDAKAASVHLADGKRVAAWSIRIPYLQFGKHLLRDIPAVVLSPEGESFGSRIGPPAFGETPVRAEPQRLQLVIGE